ADDSGSANTLHSRFVGIGARFAAAWRALVMENGDDGAHEVAQRDLQAVAAGVTRSQAQLQSVADVVGSRTRTVVDRVDEQHAVIDDTYHSIDKLNAGVRKITDNVEALSAASEETSSSMLEMVASIEEVGRHTDTLFTAVEETASATEEMMSSIGEVD